MYGLHFSRTLRSNGSGLTCCRECRFGVFIRHFFQDRYGRIKGIQYRLFPWLGFGFFHDCGNSSCHSFGKFGKRALLFAL